MVTKVCFKALSNRKIVERIIPIEHNFEIIPAIEFNGHILPETSIESQVIGYLDTIDKSDIMAKYDFDIIFDYYIKKRRRKRNEIEEFMEFLKPYITAEMQRPVEAIISESKDILFGKRKSNETKAKEVFTMLRIANKSISGTFSAINNFLDKRDVKFVRNEIGKG